MFVPVPTPAEMGQWDARAVALGVPEAVLMENAAREAFAVLRRHYGPLAGASVLIVAGSGNNGGDGICLARHLLDAGARPFLALSRVPGAGNPAASLYFTLVQTLAIPHTVLPDNLNEGLPFGPHGGADILVDALLGTGFNGTLRPREAQLVEAMNRMAPRLFVLALDVPSGLNALDGTPRPEAVCADATVTFQAAKPGLVLPHARRHTGILDVRPIGMPARVSLEIPATFRLWLDDAADLSDPYLIGRDAMGQRQGCEEKELPSECSTSALTRLRFEPVPEPGPQHKGESGRVLVIGGGAGMSGAARLAALGSLRGGAGLVCVAAPEKSMNDIRHSLPEALTLGLESTTHGEWPVSLSDILLERVRSYSALVVGPGMGRGNGAEDFLEALLRLEDRPPAVLDADALTALSRKPSLLSLVREFDILTPHPGEAGALLGTSGGKVQEDRLGALAALASLVKAVWVLKGAGTLVFAPERPVTLCPLDVPALATGGSGDVLAGLIGALLAGGMAPDLAAALGVRTHALAGLSLERSFPCRGNTAVDIADALPLATASVYGGV